MNACAGTPWPSAVRVDALLHGRAAPFGPNGEPSAIDKRPVDGPLRLTLSGLEGDEQGDLRLHGGPDKALHHFPFEHYAALAAQLPGLPQRVGGFGENLSTTGLTEADVCLGDVFALGGARIQVSQGRQPCWKLNVRFGHRGMARLIQQAGCTGWYYRVLDAGWVRAGDGLELIERPCPQASLAAILRVLYRDTLDLECLRELAALPVMPPRWRDLMRARIKRGEVEDMRPRLDTPSV